MKIIAVHAHDLDDWWGQARIGLNNLLDNHTLGRWTEPEVYERIKLGEWALFVVLDDAENLLASLVCTIAEGHSKVFEVGFCWGTDAEVWTQEINDVFGTIGKELGCDKMALNGRPGWKRFAQRLGFKINSVTYTRDL